MNQKMYANINQAVLRNITKDHNLILDVGCGTGLLGKEIKKLYPKAKVWGVDNSKETLNYATQRLDKVKFHNIELGTPSDFFDGTLFDVIIFADILEHVKNPNQVLKEYSLFLKNDGLLIISLPNIASWTIRLLLLLGKFNYTETGILDKTHLHFYTLKTGKELIQTNNLLIEKLDLTPNLVIFFAPLARFIISKKATGILIDETIFASKSYSIYKRYVMPLETKIAFLWKTLLSYQFIFVTKIKKV